MSSPRLVAAAALVDDLQHPTRLLAARRRQPPELAGRWEFPGGKVEPAEDVRDAVCRELDEELGVRVRLGTELVAPDGEPWAVAPGYVMRLWFARVHGGIPEPLVEHDELRWLPRDRLWDVPWLDGDREIVRAVEERLLRT